MGVRFSSFPLVHVALQCRHAHQAPPTRQKRGQHAGIEEVVQVATRDVEQIRGGWRRLKNLFRRGRWFALDRNPCLPPRETPYQFGALTRALGASRPTSEVHANELADLCAELNAFCALETYDDPDPVPPLPILRSPGSIEEALLEYLDAS